MKKAAEILGMVMVAILAFGALGMGQDLIISEIAWAGTAASSYDEWIELRNPGEVAVALAGWVLRIGESAVPLGEAIDATVETRTASLEANGYLLLERTDDNAVSDVTADIIYTGSLSNAGVVIELVDPTGLVVDRVDGTESGWPGGTTGSADVPYCTMERAPNLEWASNDGVTVNGLDADGNPIHGTPGQMNSADIRAQRVPQVVIEYPAEAGLVISGTTVLRWDATDPDGEAAALKIALYLSADGGNTWSTIADQLANTGSFAWDTSSTDSCESCLLRIEATDPEGHIGQTTSEAFVIE